MSNSSQDQAAQAQRNQQPNQSDAGKVGNNIRKDEPTAQKKSGDLKNDASSASGNKSSEYGAKSSK